MPWGLVFDLELHTRIERVQSIDVSVSLERKTVDRLGFIRVALLLTSKSLCFSESQFPHGLNGRNNLFHRVKSENGCEIAL